MNNRLILVISVCGNLILGLLFYEVFLSTDPIPLISSTALMGLVLGMSLNFTSYFLYREKLKRAK
jgi:hypothetical protein